MHVLLWFVESEVANSALTGKLIEEDDVEMRPEWEHPVWKCGRCTNSISDDTIIIIIIALQHLHTIQMSIRCLVTVARY